MKILIGQKDEDGFRQLGVSWLDPAHNQQTKAVTQVEGESLGQALGRALAVKDALEASIHEKGLANTRRYTQDSEEEV